MMDIDDRLHRWARWVISGDPRLGYGDRTAIYEMMRTGVIAKGFGLVREPDAIEEQETELAMKRLAEARPKEYEALVIQYLGRGQPSQKARDMGITESIYFKLIKVGKYWLEGYFEAMGGAASTNLSA